jgi:outer membrane protein assembly factor BamB
MGPRNDTRRRLGWRAGLAVLVLLMLAALLVLLFRTGALFPLTTGRSDMDWARDVEQENSTGHESAEGVVATGSGFAVVGHTNSRQPGVEQAWVLRFDKAPPPRWGRTYGRKELGTGSLGRAIASTRGGGLVVAGEEQVAVGLFQAWLLVLSPEGEVLWERTPGKEGVNGLNAVSVLEDGSIVAGGGQDGAGWVVRMDPRGELLWDVKLPRLEDVTALVSLPAQRVAVVGKAETSTVGLGLSRLLLLGADGRATAEWQLPTEGRGELNALALLPDGGLVATGRRSRPDSTDWSLWVVRMDPRGEILWEHVPEGIQAEAGHGVAVFPDGSIAVVGFSWKEMIDREAKVWRFSADGRLLWHQSYGGAGDDLGYGIARLEDESLVVVGSTTSKGAGKTDLWTFGLSPEGQLLWEETFGAP